MVTVIINYNGGDESLGNVLWIVYITFLTSPHLTPT